MKKIIEERSGDEQLTRNEAKHKYKNVWTPCKHYKQCIGFCPYCLEESFLRGTDNEA